VSVASAPIEAPDTGRLTYEPGIYPGMEDATYRRIDAVSKSDLDRWTGVPEPNARASIVGTIVHLAIPKPAEAASRVLVCPDRRNSNAWAECVEANPERWVITTGEKKDIDHVMRAVKEHPKTGPLVEYARSNAHDTELVLVWRCPETDVLCKGMIDLRRDARLGDWKTSGQYDHEAAKVKVFDYGYDEQADHYSHGYEVLTGDRLPLDLIFISKRHDKGNPIWRHQFDDAQLASARRSRMRLLRLFKQYNPDHPAALPI
jgi:hypothetical protein